MTVDGRARQTGGSTSTHQEDGLFGGRAAAEPRSPTTGSRSPTPGQQIHADDPYRFLPTLGEVDLHLIGEGRHEELWQVLGRARAHVRHHGGPVSGTSFAVWAPNARGVRVVGDFNYWDGRAASDALAGLHRRLGAVRPGRR